MLPMANSSMFVLPRTMAPASFRAFAAVAVYVGIKLYNMRELQVVRIPSVHILSLMATGTPASGPLNSPALIFSCTCSACLRAFSSSTVT